MGLLWIIFMLNKFNIWTKRKIYTIPKVTLSNKSTKANIKISKKSCYDLHLTVIPPNVLALEWVSPCHRCQMIGTKSQRVYFWPILHSIFWLSWLDVSCFSLPCLYAMLFCLRANQPRTESLKSVIQKGLLLL